MKNKKEQFLLTKGNITYFLFNISHSADAPSKRYNRQTGKKWGEKCFQEAAADI